MHTPLMGDYGRFIGGPIKYHFWWECSGDWVGIFLYKDRDLDLCRVNRLEIIRKSTYISDVAGAGLKLPCGCSGSEN